MILLRLERIVKDGEIKLYCGTIKWKDSCDLSRFAGKPSNLDAWHESIIRDDPIFSA